MIPYRLLIDAFGSLASVSKTTGCPLGRNACRDRIEPALLCEQIFVRLLEHAAET